MILQILIIEFKQETNFRKKNKIHRRQIMSCVIKDTSQRMFLELRDDTINRIRELKLEAGDFANVEIEFNGSEKGKNYFNNIVVKAVDYAWITD